MAPEAEVVAVVIVVIAATTAALTTLAPTVDLQGAVIEAVAEEEVASTVTQTGAVSRVASGPAEAVVGVLAEAATEMGDEEVREGPGQEVLHGQARTTDEPDGIATTKVRMTST